MVFIKKIYPHCRADGFASLADLLVAPDVYAAVAGFIFLPSFKHVQKSRRNGHFV
jgi:hypothetical protein